MSVKDERCPEFDSTIVEQKSWQDGDDSYVKENFACGCFHTKGDDNTPGFRDHWDWSLCQNCHQKKH